MSLKSILAMPIQLPQKIEAYLPSGAPSLAGLMAKVTNQIPDVGASAFNLPHLAPIIASVEEHIPHPQGMEIANVVQKFEFPVVSKVEELVAGKDQASAPAPHGLIALSFE